MASPDTTTNVTTRRSQLRPWISEQETAHVAGSNNDMISPPQEQACLVDMQAEVAEETPSADDLEKDAAYARFMDVLERLKAEVEKIQEGKYSVPIHVLHDLADSLDSINNGLQRWSDGNDPS